MLECIHLNLVYSSHYMLIWVLFNFEGGRGAEALLLFPNDAVISQEMQTKKRIGLPTMYNSACWPPYWHYVISGMSIARVYHVNPILKAVTESVLKRADGIILVEMWYSDLRCRYIWWRTCRRDQPLHLQIVYEWQADLFMAMRCSAADAFWAVNLGRPSSAMSMKQQ